MGLTTQYHKYTSAGICSLIGSGKCNVVWIEYGGKKGKYCAVGACENVIIWDLKTNEQIATLPGDRHEVVRLAASPNGQHLAVGYHNGTIKLFDIKSGEDLVTFSGHKTAISTLAFDERGMLLASGSKDTDIVIWDTVSQSGLYRLKGHKGLITQLVFLRSQNILISSSKDTFVKFWDLDTQHCFRTLLTHKTEVYGLQVNGNETRLYTGSADNEIRVYDIEPVKDEQGLLKPQQVRKSPDVTASKKKRKKKRAGDDDSGDSEESESEEEGLGDGEEEEEFNQEERLLSCQYMGSITRHGKGRTVSLQMDKSGRAIVCHGLDRTIESFLVLTDDERTQLQRKRASKVRKRMRAAGEDDSLTTADKHQLSVEDQHKRHEPVRLPAKPGSIDILCSSAGLFQFVALLANNSLYGGVIDVTEKKSEVSKTTHLATPGHRTDVRALSFSNDGSALASASGDQLKVWNRDSLKCIRTISCGYALCCAFLPGDRHIVVGAKSGSLQLFDIASSTMIEEIDAHTGAVWSLCVLPDKRGIVTGSADHKVKFWQFELIEDEGEEDEEEDGTTKKSKKKTKSPSVSKRLTLVPTRVLKMSDDVLCVKVSADSRFLAVSLLDNTIKVFFTDTLKFFLSLYGHSLPALCIDMSSDGTILASGSADKNIKIWGLDFGDCHKSIFAHDDSIMALTFLPKTHLFFSCGKDGAIKQWDADTFNHVTTLSPAHHGEVWSVVVSPSGMSLASSSHDKSIRVWEKADEILVLEEEKEQQREKEFDMEIEHEENPVVPGETSEEIGFASKKTVESVKSTERIMEAVELWRTEKDKIVNSDEDLHPMLRAYKCKSPVDYILEVLKKVKPSELEESLLVMPFDFSTDLLKVLDLLIRQKRCVELITKCLLFLMRIHHNQITSNQMLLPTIDRLRDSSTSIVEEYKDRIGFNLSALQLLQLRLEDNNSEQLFTDATEMFKKKEKRRKHKHKGPEIV